MKRINVSRVKILSSFKTCLKWPLVFIWVNMPLNKMFGHKLKGLKGLSSFTRELIHWYVYVKILL